MSKYAELKAQAEKYMKQAELLLVKETKEAVIEIKRLMKLYDLTAEDIGLSSAGARKAGKKTARKLSAKNTAAKTNSKTRKTRKTKPNDGRARVAPKYKDPETGATWTGRGKQPKWLSAHLSAGKSIDQFKI
jgi:DNA-binding protein H-NS